MKVLSVLLCLALAHGVTSNIFNHQNRHRHDEDIQQLDYNNPQHRPRHHHSGNKKYGQLEVNVESYQSSPASYLPQEIYNQLFPKQQSPSNQQQQQHYQNQQWNQPQNSEYHHDHQQPQPQPQPQSQPQPQRYQTYQNPTHNNYYPSSSAQQSQEQDKTYSSAQKFSANDIQKPHKHSSSSESHQNSYESKENKPYYQKDKPTLNENQKWASSQQSSDQDNEMTNNDNGVQWNKMTFGPDMSTQDKENIEKIFSDAQNAMPHLSEEEKMKYHQALDVQQSNAYESPVILNATQLAQKHQYPVEEHTVTTDDGYRLTIFRIPPKKHARDVQKSPVVFLMHGILGSADDWIVKGPQESLAYSLSDAGFDVWLGNARGNKYSQQHVSKSSALPDFWQYCTDEIALHDLPAMINYTLKATNQEKLYYIGHSLGNTAFFALTADHPEYNNKIIQMYAFSPMVYMTNVRSPAMRMMAPTSKFHNNLQRQSGYGPFAPSKAMIQTLGGNLLEKETGSKKVGNHISAVLAGFHAEEEDLPTIPVVMQHQPAGTSSKVISHYSQGVASQEFQKYDYGTALNLKVYGSEQPPRYDMQKVSVPVTLYYSEEDWLAHPKDVERLQHELPNVKEAYKVQDKHFANQDFYFSSKAPELVYKHLINSMQTSQ